jgi:membrane-associated protease RseP (regulator of RpoE activity)
VASYPGPSSPGTEIERLRATVAARFPVYETRVTPRSLILHVDIDPTTLESRFDALRRDLWEKFYVPQIRRERGEHLVEIVRRPSSTPWGSAANLLLLALTVVTTVAAGAFLWLAWRGGSSLAGTDLVNGGLYFALPLLTILGVHELAHFVMARHHHVEASLPYFIPVPPPFLLFGTFGAFISLREPIPTKKALLDIGAAGPLAGFVVAIPVTLGGLILSAHSTAISVANCGPSIAGVSYGGLQWGSSLLWKGLGLFVPTSTFSHLHPLALAGWVGLLVTAINLLPAGQLDGGHVFRALLGERSRFVSYGAVVLLVGLGLGFGYQGWLLFALLVFVLGMRHPPPLNDITPLDGKRWAVGGIAAAILVAGFVIVPLSAPSGQFAVSAGPVLQPGSPMAGYAVSDNLSIGVHDRDSVGHGYVLSGNITAVYATVNGTSQRLGGAALSGYRANASWVITYPSGSAQGFARTGSFAVPASEFFTVGAGGTATVHVLYLNRNAGVTTFSLTVLELCANGSAPISVDFSVS